MLVTIGIPFFNNASTLKDAIRSVFAQTWQNWELLLTDDGSQDDSLAIARQVKDPRVKIFSDGVNRGLVARLNQISRSATGGLIARLDADDLMHPRRLELQVQYLLEHRTVHMVGSGVLSIDPENRPIGFREMSPLDHSPARILKQGGIVHASIVGWRDWFLQNPYNPRFPRAEDRELWIRTASHSRFGKIVQPLYFVREIDHFVLSKYLESYQTERRILKNYGRTSIGGHQTAVLLARSFLKSFIISILNRLGLAKDLMMTRIQAVPPKDIPEYELMIKRILETPVPGEGPR